MPNLTAAIVLLVSAMVFAAIAAAALAVNHAMEAAGAQCEHSDLSYKCRLEW